MLPRVRFLLPAARVIITTIITMKLHETTSHQIEPPAFLWTAFKHGPGDEYDKLTHRVTELVAEDVLENAPEQLSEGEREIAEEIRRGRDV